METIKERKIMIAMDGSTFCDYAFNFYLSNISQPIDFVILFHCVEYLHATDVPLIASADVINNMIDEDTRRADTYFKKLANMMEENKVMGKIKQVVGKPRVEILRVAEEEHVEFIVTGTRGMGKVRRTLLGSVSDHVLHHSHVPVLICKSEENNHHHHHHHDRHH